MHSQRVWSWALSAGALLALIATTFADALWLRVGACAALVAGCCAFAIAHRSGRGGASMSPLWWCIGASAGVGVGAVALILILTPRLSEPLTFDRDAWLAESGVTGRATGSPPSARSRMVTDLVAKRLREGLSKADVIELLGRPPHDDVDSERWIYPAGWEEWPLGYARHMVLLLVEFDGDARVRRAHVFAKPE
jgi:hypothetical protein